MFRPSTSTPPMHCVCFELAHPIATSKNRNSPNAICTMARYAVARHARALTNPRRRQQIAFARRLPGTATSINSQPDDDADRQHLTRHPARLPTLIPPLSTFCPTCQLATCQRVLEINATPCLKAPSVNSRLLLLDTLSMSAPRTTPHASDDSPAILHTCQNGHISHFVFHSHAGDLVVT